MRIQQLYEGQEETIANLRPDSVVKVFHGTSMDQAVEFAEEGIDAKKRVPRHYPHWVGSASRRLMVNRGLFVTIDLKTALQFGDAVIKFSALGKDLHYAFPSPDLIRQARKYAAKKYPNSFRPEVSYELLDRSPEPQALFRGLLSPRAIEKVYLVHYTESGEYVSGVRIGEYNASFNREKFIEWFYQYQKKSGRPQYQIRSPDKPLVEPQERISLEELLKRIEQKYQVEQDYALELMQDAVSNQSTYRQQIEGLANFAGGPVLTYSVAKRLLPEVLKAVNVQRAPNIQEPEQYHGF